MTIPESQLETWSHQGSVAQSRDTYNTIKLALESPHGAYASKDYKVFLQGSYGNDTNIYSESDVDLVIRLDSSYTSQSANLSESQRLAYTRQRVDATYGYYDFKRDVLAWLTAKYGSSVKSGDKAIKITAGGGRRNADVVVALEYRDYQFYVSATNNRYVSGIQFFTGQGVEITNYPGLHSSSCTTKHQATQSRFKRTVRVFKNARSKLVSLGRIPDGLAPSYYIEGLLSNVPNGHFVSSLGDTFVNCVNWLVESDRSQLVCAHGRYYLLNPSSPVTWRAEQCSRFLDELLWLWNNW